MRLRIGVIGVGFIGRVHIEAIRRLGYAEVNAIASSSPENAEKHARELEIKNAYHDYRQMLDNPDIDLVHITTPNAFHYQQAKDTILAGKHVICEKPLGVSSLETAELKKLSSERDLVCSTVFNFRYFPLVQQARYLVASVSDLGKVYSVHGSFLQDWLLYPSDYNWRNDPQIGGPFQVLSTIGCHWLDLAQFVLGNRIREVFSDFRTFVPLRHQSPQGRPSGEPRRNVDMKSEDHVHTLLRFGSDISGLAVFSDVSAGHRLALEIEVSCAKGALRWHSERPNEMWWGRRGEGNVILTKDPEILAPTVLRFAHYPGGHTEGYADTYRTYFDEVYRCVARGKPYREQEMGIPTFEDGHYVQCICEAMIRSARTGAWTKVAEGD